MKVELNPENTVTVGDIDGLEQALDLTFPESFRAFLMTYGNAEPEENGFDIGDTNSSEVRRFLTPKEIEETLATIDYDFSPGQIPIAEDSCGNFVIVDLAAGERVYFWDHEIDPPLRRLADSVADFLESLEPIDPDSDEFDPSRVRSARINPDFLAKIKAESD